MDNVLVVDRERTSGFLVKSILLGRGCGVSIACTLKDARMKANTGLFDAMVIDVGDPKLEMPYIQEITDLLPGFPIVAVFRETAQSGPFVSLKKPIRVSAMSDALRHALGRSPAAWNRHNLDVPALVQVGAQFVECRTIAVSRHGVLVGPGADFSKMKEFHEFFHNKLEKEFEGRIEFPGGEESFRAKAVWSEKTVDSKLRQIGLALDAPQDWFGKVDPPVAVLDAPPATA